MIRPRLSRAFAPLAAAAVLGLAVLAPSAPTALAATPTPTATPTAAASPANDVSWGVTPANADAADGRPSFTYDQLAPGAALKDFVGIANFGKEPITLAVYAGDAINTAGGAFDLKTAAQKPVDAGSWVVMSTNTVTIPAAGRVSVPFTLTVPANATPGDHDAGIVASLSSGGTGAGAAVTVDRRVGARIYLRVAGPLQPALSVEDVIAQYHGSANPISGGSTEVSYVVHNTGNVALAGTPQISSKGLFGKSETHSASLSALLPGQSVRLRTTLHHVFPAGPLTTKVSVQPSVPQGTKALDAPLHSVSRSTKQFALPWAQILALLLILALVAGLLWVRRRKDELTRQRLAAAVEQGRREASSTVGAE